jgi:hypothetical protein
VTTRVGICAIGFVSPAREFLISGNLTSLPKSESVPAFADGYHCREMAGKVRELARYTRSPVIRRELVDLAKRYDRRGDHFDCEAAPKRDPTSDRPQLLDSTMEILFLVRSRSAPIETPHLWCFSPRFQ